MKNVTTKLKISFPHMGNYCVPVKYLLSHIFSCEIIEAPPITAKTIELGSKYSPDFVCAPFKYTLGTLLESLQEGANVLIQAGGGCRYGYYSELQEQILKDLGYQFQFLNLVQGGKTDLKKIYRDMKAIDPSFRLMKALYYLRITIAMVKYMDSIDHIIRSRIGFEKKNGSFEALQKKMLHDFSNVKRKHQLQKLYRYYRKKMLSIPICKPENCLKVGIIGELYTIMEPFSNYQIERKLASFHMEVKRYTNVHYLLFEKKKAVRKYLKYADSYVHYPMGADATDNIARAKYLCEEGYDGVIHIKSSFCTPEIGAMPLIRKVCADYKVPVLFFSFDSNTSEVGIQTRLEAFADMIEMRREHVKRYTNKKW